MKTVKIFFCLYLVNMVAIAQNYKPVSALTTFNLRMFGAKVEGSFKNFTGVIKFDPANLGGSSIAGSVDANTVDTDNSLRNRHLKDKSEFFNVLKFPKVSMKTTSIIRSGNIFIGTFDLTMKDVTKAVKIPFTVSSEGDKTVFKGNFTINRRDWGVGGGTFGMSNDVAVSIVLNTVSE